MKKNFMNLINTTEEGLFYGDELLMEDSITVIDKKTIRKPSGKTIKKYHIKVEYADGRPTYYKWVANLKKLDFYNDFEINDLELSTSDKNIIKSKLMNEANRIKNKEIWELMPGLHKINEKLVYVFADHVIGWQNSGAEFKSAGKYSLLPLKPADKKELLKTAEAYINLRPGITDILFYYSILTVLKPFISQAVKNIQSGFVLALIGPPGHLKSTLASEYALWTSNIGDQILGFDRRENINSIARNIEKYSTQNYLLDDLHKTEVDNEKKRQITRIDNIARFVKSSPTGANVILTGETIDFLSSFSEIDRMLLVFIPQMNPEQIEALKQDISKLPAGAMPAIALMFAEKIMENPEKVMDDIKNFYNRNCINKNLNICATRTYENAMFIRMAEYLFDQYLLYPGTMLPQTRLKLEQELEKLIKLQNKELENRFRSDEKPDYIVELYNILNGGGSYITSEKSLNDFKYSRDKTFMVKNGRIYITTSALKMAFYNYNKRFIHPKCVIEQLSENGILEEEPSSRGHQKNFNGIKCYVINKTYLENYVKNKAHEEAAVMPGIL